VLCNKAISTFVTKVTLQGGPKTARYGVLNVFPKCISKTDVVIVVLS